MQILLDSCLISALFSYFPLYLNVSGVRNSVNVGLLQKWNVFCYVALIARDYLTTFFDFSLLFVHFSFTFLPCKVVATLNSSFIYDI